MIRSTTSLPSSSDASGPAETEGPPGIRTATRPLLALLALLLLTAGIRSIGVTRPLVGAFATKNVVHAMIARNWVEGRYGVLYPALDCMRGGRRSLHMLEFSVSAYVTGGLWRVFGGSLDVWGRVTSILFMTAAVALLYLFVRRRHGHEAAVGAGFVLALSPVSVIYGQSFMLDASLVFFTLATFCCVDGWLDGRSPARSLWLLPAAINLALLLLTKVYLLVLLLPLAEMVWRRGQLEKSSGWQGPSAALPQVPSFRGSAALCPSHPVKRRWKRYALGLAVFSLAATPVILWSFHTLRASAPDSPTAAHIFASLDGNVQSYRPPDPLLRDPDFYRQLLDDLAGPILTPIGLALLLVGFLDRAWRRYAAWLAAMAILVLVLPRKFYEMNYYYVAVLPPLCILAGLGWAVVRRRLQPGTAATAGLLFVALVLSLRHAYRPAFVTPREDRAVVAAGLAIQGLTAEEEPVLTMHGTTIDLLYYCNRPGWEVSPQTEDLDALLVRRAAQGARYFVVAGPAAENLPSAMLQARPAVVAGNGFRVYRLESGKE